MLLVWCLIIKIFFQKVQVWKTNEKLEIQVWRKHESLCPPLSPSASSWESIEFF